MESCPECHCLRTKEHPCRVCETERKLSAYFAETEDLRSQIRVLQAQLNEAEAERRAIRKELAEVLGRQMEHDMNRHWQQERLVTRVDEQDTRLYLLCRLFLALSCRESRASRFEEANPLILEPAESHSPRTALKD